MVCDICGKEFATYGEDRTECGRADCYRLDYEREKARAGRLLRERDAARELLNGDDVTAFEMRRTAEDAVDHARWLLAWWLRSPTSGTEIALRAEETERFIAAAARLSPHPQSPPAKPHGK